MSQLLKSIFVSVSGLRAQSERMRVIAENMANAKSLPRSPDEDPYRRKVLTFSNELDRATGATLVKVDRVRYDRSEFARRYDPSHPGADETGYVREPNVNTLVEAMDMREAQRTYEANLGVIESARSMLMRTLRILN